MSLVGFDDARTGLFNESPTHPKVNQKYSDEFMVSAYSAGTSASAVKSMWPVIFFVTMLTAFVTAACAIAGVSEVRSKVERFALVQSASVASAPVLASRHAIISSLHRPPLETEPFR